MSNPTTPFSWQMPTATDLVTDLPADFEVFGQAVATSLADLLGGTTGQVLSKTSNTDMDFTWVAANPGDITGVTAGTGISGGGTSGTVTVTNDMATTITASGDIIVGTGSGTYDNLPIGTTGQILTADTTVSPYKVKWGAAPTSGDNWSLLNAGGTALSGSTTTISGISGANKIMVIIGGGSSALNGDNCFVTFNGTGDYQYIGLAETWASSYAASNFSVENYSAGGTAYGGIYLAKMSNTGGSTFSGALTITGCNSSGIKAFQSVGGGNASGSTGQIHFVQQGLYTETAAITQVSIKLSGSTFDAGTVYVYTTA